MQGNIAHQAGKRGFSLDAYVIRARCSLDGEIAALVGGSGKAGAAGLTGNGQGDGQFCDPRRGRRCWPGRQGDAAIQCSGVACPPAAGDTEQVAAIGGDAAAVGFNGVIVCYACLGVGVGVAGGVGCQGGQQGVIPIQTEAFFSL